MTGLTLEVDGRTTLYNLVDAGYATFNLGQLLALMGSKVPVYPKLATEEDQARQDRIDKLCLKWIKFLKDQKNMTQPLFTTKPDAAITLGDLVERGHQDVTIGQLLTELGIEVPPALWSEQWEQVVNEIYLQFMEAPTNGDNDQDTNRAIGCDRDRLAGDQNEVDGGCASD